MSKIPKYKFQISNKFQIPISKRGGGIPYFEFCACDLLFVCFLVLGIWYFPSIRNS